MSDEFRAFLFGVCTAGIVFAVANFAVAAIPVVFVAGVLGMVSSYLIMKGVRLSATGTVSPTGMAAAGITAAVIAVGGGAIASQSATTDSSNDNNRSNSAGSFVNTDQSDSAGASAEINQSDSTNISVDCANPEVSEGIPKGRLEVRDLVVYWSSADSPRGVGDEDYDYDEVPWLLIYENGQNEIETVTNVHFEEPSYCWDGLLSGRSGRYVYGMRSGRTYTFALVDSGHGGDQRNYPRITNEVTITLP